MVTHCVHLRYKSEFSFIIHKITYNKFKILVYEFVFWCRRRVDTGVSSRRPEFDPGLFHMKFVVEKMSLGRSSTSFSIFFSTRLHPNTSPSRCKSGRSAGTFKRWNCLLGEKWTKENTSNSLRFHPSTM